MNLQEGGSSSRVTLFSGGVPQDAYMKNKKKGKRGGKETGVH